MLSHLIWIVEDEEPCQFVYREILDLKYNLEFFETYQDLEGQLSRATRQPDIVIADLRLPKGNFLEFLPTMKKKFCSPFMVVSSVDDHEIMRFCLDEGAADFLTKPFNSSELKVKIERLLLLNSLSEPVSVDFHRLALKNQNTTVQLTPKEMQIFSTLQKHKKMSREQIMKEVWGDVVVEKKVLDVHLFNLRKKAKPLGVQIFYSAPNQFTLAIDSASPV